MKIAERVKRLEGRVRRPGYWSLHVPKDTQTQPAFCVKANGAFTIGAAAVRARAAANPKNSISLV